ncbi:response regulator [Parabacteroides sp. OttesenSCG-928-N08]|nr:response regulator [Parabacteroides sp. OttesenSCG-928-N08]
MIRTLVYCLLLLLPATPLFSQRFAFARLDNTHGLSNNQVEEIFKDSRGFVWIKTNSGLNRYDGYHFKTYKHNADQPDGLPHGIINQMMEDNQGNLWMLLNGATYIMYDYQNDRFVANTDTLLVEMNLPERPALLTIDAQGDFYAYYPNQGIFKRDMSQQTTHLIPQSDEIRELEPGRLLSITVKGSCVWVLHDDWLLECFDQEEGRVVFRDALFRCDDKNNAIAKKLYVDNDNDLWVYPGIHNKGVSYYSQREQRWHSFTNSGKPALTDNNVADIVQDGAGYIWIGTFHEGINIFDKKSRQIGVLKNNIYDETSLSQNSINRLYCDSDSIVWVGTYKNGISYYHPHMFKFENSPLFYHLGNESNLYDCNCFHKESDGTLWIGTNGRGLIRYNEQSDLMQLFEHQENNRASISSNIITALTADHSGLLWIGTYLGGVNTYNGRAFERYQPREGGTIYNNSVYGIKEDINNNLWFGTLGGGVDMLDASRQNATNYTIENTPELASNYILSLFADEGEAVYLSTPSGVNRINTHSRKITNPFKNSSLAKYLEDVTANNTISDSRGLVWIATDNGLNIYDPESNETIRLTTREGMPSDEVVSLVEDNNRNVWAGTRNGLVCIYCRYDDGKLSYRISAFDARDGIPSPICNPNAIYKDSDGNIYVGCVKGYISFNPDRIRFNQAPPKPRFTDLMIAGQLITPGVAYNNRVIIQKTISDLDKITLNHRETNFSIRFSAMNYVHPGKNRYRYRLEGLEESWQQIDNGVGVASYSNLGAGTYRLVVYAANNDDVWAAEPLVMQIKVNPPFWLSWWAFTLYAIIAVMLIRALLLFQLNKQKAKYEQEQKIREINRQHELDELKFKFFTNVSHEFKTPLSLIVTPLEKLLKEPEVDDAHRTILQMMHRNALSLLSMVNNILDFRKLDLNKTALNPSTGDVVAFVRNICLSFQSLATEKAIQLSFTTYLTELNMEFDPDKLSKIIANLLSNAIKYTKKGQVDLSLSIMEIMEENADRFLSIKVVDTGVGIAKEHLDKIFERFYRIDKQSTDYQPGTGVGLHLVNEYVKLHKGFIKVESTVGEGTELTVLIPINETLSTPQPLPQTEEESGDTRNTPLLMIIDDNADFRQFTANLFASTYRIVTAADGVEGCEAVLKHLPDMILCDVMMPGMDGYAFCKRVKEDIRTSHIPIILLTAKSSEENRYLGIEAGADDYIAKPFSIDLLSLKIAKIIERQKKNHATFKNKIDIAPGAIEVTSMDEKFVKRAVAIVEQNMEKPEFLVEDLCREMGMSRVYFYKKILALTDKTPSEFIRFIRLQRAAALLQKSQLYVNEIALQVGFNEPKYFRKHFKDEFGMTPNEYKKAHEGGESSPLVIGKQSASDDSI